MNRLRIIPLDDMVAFPGMPVALQVDMGRDDRVLLVPRHDHTYSRVGVVAEVSERVRLAGRGLAVSVMPLHRAIPGGAGTDEDGALRVDFESRPDQTPAPTLTRELEREYRAVVDEILELRGDDGRIRSFERSITDAGALAEDRKSTRLNSSHSQISYAVFCLKKKNNSISHTHAYGVNFLLSNIQYILSYIHILQPD